MSVTTKTRYGLILLVASAVLACTNLHAGRPDRSPGVFIPILKNTRADEFSDTSWVSDARGAHLEVRASREAAWLALEQALTNLGIKALKKNPVAGEWLTDWVVWKYDKETGKAQSKPGFSLKKQNLERHRFLFTLKAGDSADRVMIVATDTARQREVDITPDSEYSWMEWKARDSQQEAADTFLQRLQLPIESALATRFVVSREIARGKGGAAIVADTDSRADADVVMISIPAAAVAVEPPPVREVQTPAPPAPTPPAVTIPDRGITTAPQPAEPPVRTSIPAERASRLDVVPPDAVIDLRGNVSTESSIEESTAMPPLPTRAKSIPAATDKLAAPEPDYLDLSPGEPQALTPSESKQLMTEQPVAVPEPATNGLLVRAAPAVTWPALLQSLKDLDIAIEQSDERQHTLQTGWVDASYDAKKQLLVTQSKDKPMWAFSVFGKGIERQRFQVVMVPANEGTRSIIYAYHTGSQEQVDLTPDSSQTMLSWEDRETSPDVAVAFLRKLRIMIPH